MKKYILTTVAILVIIIGAGFFYAKKGEFSASKTNGSGVSRNPEKSNGDALLKKSFVTPTPKNKMPLYNRMSDDQLMQEVHEMTHQKVQAEQKWGASEITKDKVLKLYEVVKNKQFKDSQAKQMLLGILEPWTKGDFSNAVTAHNEIWKYQNGTVGKANRLLTAKEETEFIQQNF